MAIKWFEGVLVKGFRCETLVFKSTEQNAGLLSAGPLVRAREGGRGGRWDTQEQFAIQRLNAGRLLLPPPPAPRPCAAGEGADRDGTDSSPHNGGSRERPGK